VSIGNKTNDEQHVCGVFNLYDMSRVLLLGNNKQW